MIERTENTERKIIQEIRKENFLELIEKPTKFQKKGLIIGPKSLSDLGNSQVVLVFVSQAN